MFFSLLSEGNFLLKVTFLSNLSINYPEMTTLLPLTKLYIEILTVYRLKGEVKIAIKRNPKAQTFVLEAK